MLLALLKDARHRSQRGQHGFTLVELLVVIAILGVLAAIVLFNISGVNANAACNGMKTDGATIQGAADLYWNSYQVYPVGTNNPASLPSTPASVPAGFDVAAPAAGTTVNQFELLTANLLHSSTANWNSGAPANGTELFTYKGGTPTGSVHGQIQGIPAATCSYN
ncbi:MAG TPA: type II secretion system protein [Candidatus Dormibacteraeota bacterium]|jgi:prepilin-type N-terminal cleavage/methylation domain-containing protein|nr:type II secretion system protein [Candidatus Dormibacteraeota bacterium]